MWLMNPVTIYAGVIVDKVQQALDRALDWLRLAKPHDQLVKEAKELRL